MNPDPDDVTFQFNQIQLTLPEEVKEGDDADVTFGFNRIDANDESKSLELTPENSPENDDVDHDGENDSVSQKFTPQNDDVDNEGDDVNFGFSQVNANDGSKSVELTAENDDVTFGFSQVQIDSKPQQFTPESSPENDDVDDDDDDVTFGCSQAQINTNEEADVEGEEFTFMCINSDNSITELTEKTVFPLFDQSLLYNNFNQDGKRINDIHVDNVFIESPRAATSSSSSSSSTSTTLTAITDSNEMNIKSNSTGFSKLWRFRDNNNINRSNSDGRDAFVFLNPKTEGKTEGKAKGKVVSEGEGKVVVKKKVKKANVSAHEVYLKKAKGGGEEEKRKSYLPYRPGLMGFFTNVNGGLSKNVHPF